MIVVDASVFVAVSLSSDVFHGVSMTWMQHAITDGQRLLAPHLVLPEVAGAVTRQTSTQRGEQALQALLRMSALRLVPTNRRRALEAARLATMLHLRGADAMYVAVAAHFGIPLISWDKEHLTRANQQITVYSPDTAPV